MEKTRKFDDIISKINAQEILRYQASINSKIVQQETVALQKPPAEDCTHWWKIETPAGETSMGICAHCGGTRPFSNSLVVSEKYKYKGGSTIPKTEMDRADEDLDNDTFG